MIFRGVPYTIENGVRVYDCLQKSEAWDNLRAGIATTSDFDEILTPVTGELSKQCEGYAVKKVTELFLQRPVKKDLYTRAMKYGTVTEDSARQLYEMTYKVKTRQVGFMTDLNHQWGASPDSLIGDDEDLEIKCCDEDTHMKYLLFPERFKKAYNYQAQGRMFIHGRKAVNLWAYNPEMPPVRIRCERDEEYIAKLAKALDGFRSVMNGMIENLVKQGYMKL